MDDLTDRRRIKERQKLGGAILDILTGEDGEDLEGFLIDLTGSAPGPIREALCDALLRGKMIHEHLEAQAKTEDEPGHCANAVCREWVQSEGEETSASGEVSLTGKRSFCGFGDAEASGCPFRMREAAPSNLHGVDCQPIPEWAEAVRMLRRAGLLEPDSFGFYNGTDFVFHKSTRHLWWCLIELLIESGRLKRSWVEEKHLDPGETMIDRGAEQNAARRLLFPPEGGHGQPSTSPLLITADLG